MVLAVVLADRVIRRQVVARLISWRSRPARLYRLRRWSWLVLTACLMLAVAALVLPLLAVCIRAGGSTPGKGLHPGNLTSEVIRRALTWDDFSNRGWFRSPGFAGLTAAICGGL